MSNVHKYKIADKSSWWHILAPKGLFQQYEVVYWGINAQILSLDDKA